MVLDAASPGDTRLLTASLTDLDLIRKQNRVFENIVGSSSSIALLDDGVKTYQFNDSQVTSDAFDFYGVPALLGRGIEPEDGNAGAPPRFCDELHSLERRVQW